MIAPAPAIAPPQVQPGLRARSKAKRRALIQRSAMRLFAERGYEATTIVDIAEAADIAPRTISAYFPSKLDLATSFADEIAARLTATYAALPGVDILAVIDGWLTQETDGLDSELARLVLAMNAANPELAAVGSARVAEAVEVGSAAVAVELGRPIEHPMVTICSAAMGAVLAAYLMTVAQSGASPALHDSMMTFLRGMIDAAKVTN
jgi:AcrR family transcriptional regulator